MKLARADGRMTNRGVQAESISRPGAGFRTAVTPARAFAIGIASNEEGPPREVVGAAAPALYFCASTASAMASAASFADIVGVFTNEVMTSMIAPRYFCRIVMLCAIERTSVPPAIEA